MRVGQTEQDDFEARLQHDKLSAIKELAYGASHEINNPLANIAARAQTLLRDESEPDRRRALQAIHQQALRAHEMISDLMLFARPPRLELKPFDLCQLVERVVGELGSSSARAVPQIAVNLPDEPIDLTGDSQQLAVAAQTVFLNAVEAVGESGSIEISVSLGEVPNEAPTAAIAVKDNGPGLSDAAREHLFDPFYSGREAGRGLGFGLSKCWRIVTEHGGSVLVDSQPGQGATVTLLLPLAGPSAKPAD